MARLHPSQVYLHAFTGLVHSYLHTAICLSTPALCIYKSADVTSECKLKLAGDQLKGR